MPMPSWLPPDTIEGVATYAQHASRTMTPHQREVYNRLVRYSGPSLMWVNERWIGSHTALWHLLEKGHVDAREVRGRRGGSHFYYRPSWSLHGQGIDKG